MYDDKSYNPPIMFAVEESELQRFRELETKNNLLKVQTECLAIENERLKQENEQLKAQIEKMKCCWNCKHPAKGSTGCCCPFAASCHNRSLWEMGTD
jgi:hypothetical protein